MDFNAVAISTAGVPEIDIAKAVETAIDFLSDNFSPLTRAISDIMESLYDMLVSSLLFFNPLVIILAITLLAWIIGKRNNGLMAFFGLLLIWNMGLWEPTIETISLVLISTTIAVGIGLPIGIFSALYTNVYRIVMPILDFMQTMPAFVYLIPAIPFFGLGPVSATFSTVIFAMPPAIRLTCLGIRQLPEQLIEAADAFGSSRPQKLFKVQLPLAMPTIMAGINQTIMLSLSMVVIAAMIGAGGLGSEVWKAIQRFKPGDGFEAGLSVVIVAIILDRITQQIAKTEKQKE
jgi:glycine betaine/proline transport system permease protein